MSACDGSGAPSLPEGEVRPTEVVTLALNANPRTPDFVIEASNSVRMQTGSAALSGDVAARGAGSGPFLSGGVPLDVLGGARVDTTHNSIADSVHLASGAVVGDVQTAHFSGAGSTHGAVSGLVSLPALPTAATVTSGTSAISVGAGATVTKPPGRYAAVTIGTGGILRVGGGTYEFASVSVSSGGRIEATDAVQLDVAGRWSSADGSSLGPRSGTSLTAKSIRLEVSGANGSPGGLSGSPKAASFGSGNQIRAP